MDTQKTLKALIRYRASAQRLSASRMNGREQVIDLAAVLSRAQRLSASRMNGPQAFVDAVGASEVCSTPFGITDEWTGGLLLIVGPLFVLNAFRHHG